MIKNKAQLISTFKKHFLILIQIYTYLYGLFFALTGIFYNLNKSKWMQRSDNFITYDSKEIIIRILLLILFLYFIFYYVLGESNKIFIIVNFVLIGLVSYGSYENFDELFLLVLKLSMVILIVYVPMHCIIVLIKKIKYLIVRRYEDFESIILFTNEIEKHIQLSSKNIEIKCKREDLINIILESFLFDYQDVYSYFSETLELIQIDISDLSISYTPMRETMLNQLRDFCSLFSRKEKLVNYMIKDKVYRLIITKEKVDKE